MPSMNPKEALMEKFKQVCTERINTLQENFTALQETPDSTKYLDLLMREIHTLKGELRIMGFTDGGQIVHVIEDVLKELAESSFTQAADFSDTFIEGLDIVSGIVIKGDKPNIDQAIKIISDWKETSPAKPPVETQKKTTTSKSKTPEKNQAPSNAASRSDKKSDKQTSAASSPGYQMSSMVRVSGQALDELSAMIGDLFTAHLRLRELSSAFDDSLEEARDLIAAIKNTRSNGSNQTESQRVPTWKSQQLGRNLAQLRRTFYDRTSGMAMSMEQVLEQVKELRLLPISTLFDLYKTAARDIARHGSKKILVRSEGGNTMVDRSVMDALGDILLHLIRNAVDHGIEPKSEREKQKKQASGTLTMRAFQSGDRVIVEVEDDGKGIDYEKVKQSIVKKNLASKEELGNKTQEEILDYIFQPGFSTTDKATEISGRGVGMDVVRTRVQEFGGSLQVRSHSGKGTCFSLELPTSIAINRVLLFKASEQIFAVLATFVGRVDRVNPDNVIESSGTQAVVVDDQTVTIVDASHILQLDKSALDLSNPPMIVLNHGGRKLALVVDELLGERELTIKPLGTLLTGTHAISGAATLEDGSVILLLSAGDLVTHIGRLKAKSVSATMPSSKQAQRALLVEDSLVTRELERGMLTSLGIIVEEASDGLEALDKLRTMDFDIIITDVEMPRLDGFGLTQRVKNDERYSHIPVILVTTQASDEDRQRGIAVGADAHVSKDDFHTKTFLETVRRFLS